MTFEVYRPYPGVALVCTKHASVLLGAPADAFKATKALCALKELPFPRSLVAPSRLLVGGAPQFAPEFFLYDFLFVYGAAFKPALFDERLELVVPEDRTASTLEALRMTLLGPSRREMHGYVDAEGKPLMSPGVIDMLGRCAEDMAIKGPDRNVRPVQDMVRLRSLEGGVLDGALRIEEVGPQAFVVQGGGREERVELSFEPPVTPFATLPSPNDANTPVAFGVKTLGSRSGFDLSGPTTGFLVWINGRALIYDGPPGTPWLLEQQGIDFADIDGVVLSHCHEDHMGAFVDLILGHGNPRVYTSEPIFRSVLVKLRNFLQCSEEEARKLVRYHCVEPDVPVSALGAELSFFYTAHAIPTLGMRACFSAQGRTHTLQISGDTLHHDGLDAMCARGAMDEARRDALKGLVPRDAIPDALFFNDVGEAIIHGHPKDWQGNPNRVVYYHCPNNEHTRSFGHAVADPGDLYVLAESPRIHPSFPGRLVEALGFLRIHEPKWLSRLLYQGRALSLREGEVIAAELSRTQLCVVVSGRILLSHGSKALGSVGAGEFFGAPLALKQTPEEAVADIASEIFCVPSDLIEEFLIASGADTLVAQAGAARQFVDSSSLFRRLPLPLRQWIAMSSQIECYVPRQVIVTAGDTDNSMFLLTEGTVTVRGLAQEDHQIAATDRDPCFGVVSAVYAQPRPLEVIAKTSVQALRIAGATIRHLFAESGALRRTLEGIMRRGD